MNVYKVCNICYKKKNIKFFRINRNKCKKCIYNNRFDYFKEYRLENLEKIREINRKSYRRRKPNPKKVGRPKKPKKIKPKYPPVNRDKPLEFKLVFWIKT